MKVMLLIAAILMFSLNGFAKVKTQKKSSKDAYSFDIEVYYKLKFADREKYLKLYVDFVKEVDTEKQASHNSQFDLYRILFPTADAAYGKDYCLTGGVFYAPPCNDASRQKLFSEDIKVAFSGCASGNRCAAYFGLDASGNGLCYKNEGSATSECAKQSNDTTIQKLNQTLANRYDPKAIALQKALDQDLNQNNLIKKYCLDKSAKGPACKRLAAGVTNYNNKKGGTGTDTPPAEMGKGCGEAEAQALSKKENKVINPIWHKMLGMSAFSCGKPFEDRARNLGVCSLQTESPIPNVDRDLSSGNYDNLKAAINDLQNGREVKQNSDGWNSFTNYFGITPAEHKNIFCAKSSKEAWSAMKDHTKFSVNNPSNDANSQRRRDQFKKCFFDNIKEETVERNGVKEYQYLSKNHYDVCRFKEGQKFEPGSPRFNDLVANLAKYKGKMYFSDNRNGNCYALEKVSNNCSDIGDLRERQRSGLSCESDPNKTQGYFRLNPVHKSDSSATLTDGKTLFEKFAPFEYNCGENAKRCGADTDYKCVDERGNAVQ